MHQLRVNKTVKFQGQELTRQASLSLINLRGSKSHPSSLIIFLEGPRTHLKLLYSRTVYYKERIQNQNQIWEEMGRAQGKSKCSSQPSFPHGVMYGIPSSSHNVWSIASQKGSPETLVSRMLLGLNHLLPIWLYCPSLPRLC